VRILRCPTPSVKDYSDFPV